MSDPGRPPVPPPPATQPLPAQRPARPIAREPIAPEPLLAPEPPLGPNDPRWWETPGGAFGAGVLGLIVGALIGYLVGHGNAKTVTERQSGAAPTVTRTVQHTVRTPPRVVVHTHTVTVTSTTQTPSPSSEGGGEGQTYSGTGNKSLGTITVTRESNLQWTSSGRHFEVLSGEETPVSSSAHSGSTPLEAATYANVRVNADGQWTIKIVPR
jgi:hypothetical protein